MPETLIPARSLPLTDLSEDERMFRDQVREFAEAEVRPLVGKMDEEAHIPRELIDKCFDLGIMGVEIPEAMGGAAATFFMSVLVVEELARVDASLAVLVDVQNTLVNNALLRWGTDEQKARYLPKLASKWVGAYALSEAGSGSDAFALACRAVEEGDHYELTGRKLWITNAAEADLFIVMATIDPGKGYKIAIETLNEGRIGIGAQMVGVAQGAFEQGLRYAQERRQFGRPIAEFQAVQFLLAELATELEASRLLTYNAARRRDTGAPFIKEAAMAKLFASRAAEHVTSKVIEIHGGYGFSREYPVEKYFRDQKVGQIYEGTTHMQLMVIAKQLLGKL